MWTLLSRLQETAPDITVTVEHYPDETDTPPRPREFAKLPKSLG